MKKLKHRNTLLLTSLFVFLAICGYSQIVTNYSRKGMKTKFEIGWNADNYGTIQWQQSKNNGDTWVNVVNANKPIFEFTASSDGLYRAKIDVNGCEPTFITREIKVVDFSIELSMITAFSAVFEIDGISFSDANIVEYGYVYNRTELSPRSYENNYQVKVGDAIPISDTFKVNCENLLPGTAYSIRIYFKTEDGSMIYGPGRIANTPPGIKWTNENWILSQTEIAACFEIADYNSTLGNPNVVFSIGESENNKKEVEVIDLGNSKYVSTLVSNLNPNTTYYLQVKASIDGEIQHITKEIKTLSDYSLINVDTTNNGVKHTIRWDKATNLSAISPQGLNCEYPRVTRISADTLLCTYHGGTQGDHWVNIYMQRSFDNGRTWGNPETLMDKEKSSMGERYWRFCNPEVVKLQNGRLLMSFIGNGRPETNDNCHVMVMTSEDNGQTWSDPQIMGRGRTWEPMVVQLPNGELEMYVSSEAAWYQNGSDVYQDILYSNSTDNGDTWTEFKRACYSPNRRDGMPVAILQQGNKGILFSIEIVNDGGFGSPSMLHRSLNGEWNSIPWNGISDNDRWHVNIDGHGGGPYCIQLPTGEIVVSAHTNGRNGIWQTSYPRIVVGDNDGKNFTTPVTPITGLPSTEGAYYNSLFLKDEKTVWLVITHSLYNGNTRVKGEIQYLEGKIVEKN